MQDTLWLAPCTRDDFESEEPTKPLRAEDESEAEAQWREVMRKKRAKA